MARATSNSPVIYSPAGSTDKEQLFFKIEFQWDEQEKLSLFTTRSSSEWKESRNCPFTLLGEIFDETELDCEKEKFNEWVWHQRWSEKFIVSNIVLGRRLFWKRKTNQIEWVTSVRCWSEKFQIEFVFTWTGSSISMGKEQSDSFNGYWKAEQIIRQNWSWTGEFSRVDRSIRIVRRWRCTTSSVKCQWATLFSGRIRRWRRLSNFPCRSSESDAYRRTTDPIEQTSSSF